MKVVDEDTRWYLSASRTKLRQDVRCNVVVANDVVELKTVELEDHVWFEDRWMVASLCDE
jgi:hypothetical protein